MDNKCTCRMIGSWRGPSHSEWVETMQMCPLHTAAPALLEALEDALHLIETEFRGSLTANKARAAIAAAKGE